MRQLVRQGDVLIVPIDQVPANVTPVPRENGAAILAHGEATGHAHRILDESAELVTAEGAAELYLLVNGDQAVELTHDEHDTIRLDPGAYEVRRQREYAPEENRLVAD